MKIKVINWSKHRLPAYSTEASAGVDLRANRDNDTLLNPLQRCLVRGLFPEIPVGYEVQIRSRSGLVEVLSDSSRETGGLGHTGKI
jgi:dUTP pyrophosphatase